MLRKPVYEKTIGYGGDDSIPKYASKQVIVRDIGFYLTYCRYHGMHCAVIRIDNTAKSTELGALECIEITSFDQLQRAKEWADANYPDDGTNWYVITKDYQVVDECS